ncbi:MAG: restriction endonuclease subunit S [Mycoplasma sp.]
MKSKEFLIKDLFDVYGSGFISPSQFEEGDVPFLNKSNINNGVTKWIDPKGHELYKGNCIVCGEHSAKAFYQERDFLTSNQLNRMYLKDSWNYNLNEFSALYICSVFNKLIDGEYSYDYLLSKGKLEKLKISLPVAPNGSPDWGFMEQSVRELEQSVREQLLKTIPKLDDIDTSNWKTFNLKDLFTISKCKGTSKQKLKPGNIPWITRSVINNGLTGYCGNIDLVNKGNSITIHAEWKDIYCAFYQKEDFVTDKMIAMLENPHLTENVGLFISTILSHTPYNQKGLLDSLKDVKISLPVAPDGSPDWGFMEQYMVPKN